MFFEHYTFICEWTALMISLCYFKLTIDLSLKYTPSIPQVLYSLEGSVSVLLSLTLLSVERRSEIILYMFISKIK